MFRHPVLFAALLTVVLAACRTTEPSSAPRAASAGEVEDVQRRVELFIDQYLDENPAFARGLGFHQFDGKASPVGTAAVDKATSSARAWLKTLTPAQVKALPDPVRLDVQLTHLQAEQTLFAFEERQEHRRVLSYGDQFDVSGYLQRDYAPLSRRVDALVRHLEQASRNVEVWLALMEPLQPRTHLATARIVFEGHVEYFKKDVLDLVEPALAADPTLRARFNGAHQDALKALARVLTWIERAQSVANEDFRLGDDRLIRMLQVNEGMTTTLAHLRVMAEEDFQRNHDAFVAVAAQIAPGRPPAEVAAMVAKEHVAADLVLSVAEQQLTELRAFIEANDVITIPGGEEARVALTPPFMRYNSAFLDSAGPFELARVSFYYITPPDPSWTREKQEGYLPYAGDLMATSIHEVYPGHFVHGLHARNARTRAQKMFSSYAFTEGWAHYAEQMMLDAGFGKDDPKMKLGQLANALLRNCRFLATLGLHAGQMTVDGAERLFQEQCFIDAGNAQQQAFRGTYDPGYLSYTLGKLQILELRKAFFANRGTTSLKQFHDWLLSFGGAPVPFVQERL